MKKWEEEQYLFDNIKDQIYPWIKESLIDHIALNGKYISEKDTPIVSFVGDLMIIFVIDRGMERFEIIKDNMLPPDCDIEGLYHIACENLARDVKFVVSHTMYGGFGIIADGHHEASSLCFKQIWSMCSEKLKDDLVIIAPSKDMVLFVPASDKIKIEQMQAYADQCFRRSRDKISKKPLLFVRKQEELRTYENAE